jgi:DNA methylase
MSKEEQQSLGRNKRSVWTIATRPYPEAHFATFPPDLVEPCILAGTPPKVCGECGAPWQRLTNVSYENPGNRSTNGPRSIERKHLEHGSAGYAQRLEKRVTTTGWQPTCDHDDDSGRAVVLDPFAGAGTTNLVATQLGRDSIGIELNPTYAEMAEDRIRRWEANPAGHLKSTSIPREGQGTIDELLQPHPENQQEGAIAAPEGAAK